MCDITNVGSQKLTLEKLRIFSPGLYCTTLYNVESHSVMSQKLKSKIPKLSDPNVLRLWHDKLGYLGTTMLRKIINNSYGHSLANHQLTIPSGYFCTPFSHGKFITKPYFFKIASESPSFLQRIQGDICGLIDPPSGHFMYFMVLTRESVIRY